MKLTLDISYASVSIVGKGSANSVQTLKDEGKDGGGPALTPLIALGDGVLRRGDKKSVSVSFRMDVVFYQAFGLKDLSSRTRRPW